MYSSPIKLINNNFAHIDKLAVVDAKDRHSYGDLLDASARVATFLTDGKDDLKDAPVLFMVPSGFDYVAVQWGIWRAGGIAVPLSISHPLAEIEYILEDTGSSSIIAHPEFESLLAPLARAKKATLFSTGTWQQTEASEALPEVEESRPAMIIYTSGTTSKPKGVLSTHANIKAQISALVQAWEWQSSDYIINVLPMHHVHGIINVLSCALWVGATCEMHARFDAAYTWQRLIESNSTLFMAVPTIYNRLIDYWEKASPEQQQQMSAACARLRLMVSGSAALPLPVLEKWEKISGHVLLERYGMTETGMILSNPLHGKRLPGFVGSPLPGVEVRLADENNREISSPDTPGEIQVKGPAVFQGYWNKAEATRAAFKDGWFLTGDIAVKDALGNYKIMGRNSTDIIKTGGYKVSALEIEEVLLSHPQVRECAVVGLPDKDWGERIGAAMVYEGEKMEKPADETLRNWMKERMAHYKVPTIWQWVDQLPRNALGKVLKPEVKKGFQA